LGKHCSSIALARFLFGKLTVAKGINHNGFSGHVGGQGTNTGLATEGEEKLLTLPFMGRQVYDFQICVVLVSAII
jgi:hypothetical protein